MDYGLKMNAPSFIYGKKLAAPAMIYGKKLGIISKGVRKSEQPRANQIPKSHLERN